MTGHRQLGRGLIGVLAGLAILTSGCGPHPTPGGVSPSATSGPRVSTTPSGPATSASTAPPPTGASKPPSSGAPGRPPVVTGVLQLPPADQTGPTVTVHGTVQQADTMPGCVVFKTDAGQQFLLTGQASSTLPRAPEGGATPMQVTGHIGLNQPTHCMLGRPFVADSMSAG